ncbi:MAG: hypothetical protein MZV65_37420 [Chromatiales bacterium]|nr:hypothetical protein [Chromatiales bacterium]
MSSARVWLFLAGMAASAGSLAAEPVIELFLAPGRGQESSPGHGALQRADGAVRRPAPQ